jgi:hypothetical protein
MARLVPAMTINLTAVPNPSEMPATSAGMTKLGLYFPNNFIASSASTPPVISIGSHLVRAATSALVIMI